ncbi:MAG: hypothetical protein ACRC8A_14340 [Microcoleaceae cyanobacterium]
MTDKMPVVKASSLHHVHAANQHLHMAILNQLNKIKEELGDFIPKIVIWIV